MNSATLFVCLEWNAAIQMKCTQCQAQQHNYLHYFTSDEPLTTNLHSFWHFLVTALFCWLVLTTSFPKNMELLCDFSVWSGFHFFFFFFSAKDYSNCKTSLFFKFCNPPAPMQYWDDTEIWVNVFICSIFPSNKAGIVIVSISFFFVLSHFLFLNNYSQVQRLQWSLNQPFLETQKRFQWLPILFWKVNLPLLAMTNYLIRKVFISTAKNSFWN